MKKKILVLGIAIISVLIIMAFATNSNDTKPQPESQESIPTNIESEIYSNNADVIMPNKVSRPGCEEDNRCYVPTTFSIAKGQTVVWSNQDVAFHSVTSGTYGSPSGLFDSGHLDPYESFSYTFDESGTFDYFCTLHPWMAGQILVK